MNYDLAKKLKDAGWPQHIGLVKIKPYSVKTFSGLQITSDDYVAYPFLEELIEACGEGFHSLLHVKEGEWRAIQDLMPKEDSYHDETGPTPSEAVANLWLALHEPRTDV